jgi:hypothetical protein
MNGRDAGVAQLVEQRIRNAKVGGSTPLAGTIPSLSVPWSWGPALLASIVAGSRRPTQLVARVFSV